MQVAAPLDPTKILLKLKTDHSMYQENKVTKYNRKRNILQGGSCNLILTHKLKTCKPKNLSDPSGDKNYVKGSLIN